MTIEQQIGQSLMVGYKTPNVNEIIENIKRYNFGNVILFTRNIQSTSQLKDVTGRIQETAMQYNGMPAFIAIDQEGGSVRRIYEGVTKVPGAMAIAASSQYYPDAAGQIGSIVGNELKNLGINFNLAPVVDINDNPFNPVIAIRSFGDNPLTVSDLAFEYATALSKSGVMPCYKHFLGHGSVDVDSHIDLPRLEKSLSDLENCELIPYNRAGQIEAIMTAHILSTKLDDQFPASISKKILKNLLRDKMGFNGLIITDCFEMEGLIRTFSFEEAATFAMMASTDIITVSHTFGRQLTVRNALLTGVKNGSIDEIVLNRAFERISRMKKKYCQEAHPVIDEAVNKKTAESISRCSVTIADGTPFDLKDNVVVVGVTNYINSIAEDTNVEKMDIAKILGEKYNLPYKSIDNKNFNTQEILHFVKGHKVLLALADSHLTLVQKVLYSSIAQICDIMLISLRTPYDVLGQTAPKCHICIYEYTELSIASLLHVLDGHAARGRLPVKLDKNKDKTGNGYILERVLEYLKKNFSKKLSLDSVASEFYLSGGHLCKLMKKRLNKNFVDVLSTMRVDEAKKLLTTTDLKVYEVGALCGYADCNYFVKIFKKYSGVTPNYYREHSSHLD